MIEINNLTKVSINKKSFSQVAKKVLIGENKITKNISLAFVGKEEIKKINKKFRKKNKATDVLSFNLGQGNYLGEIVICPEVVKEKDEEIMEVFIHGILHLLGYDHEKSKKDAELMEKKQEKYLSNI
ncbi:MAG: rRNA maturation RNase YbeY [Candidatus Staskawiczbacteria bacterium]|jgi:probable rRNA maturation factor